jgi:Aerotolerance regulator N-terminal/von Willebrand factor type A domain/CARDB
VNFLNAALLTGIAALSIPIIIHLFHKSRFKIVKWGAMHLLEAVIRTNQRRVRIEQWILLAIRCLIPALLAFLMARPIWIGASKLLGDTKTSTVVLLDNSYSMEAGRAGTTNWAIARDEASRLVGGLRGGSEAHVILMGQGGGGLLDTPTYDLSRVTQALAKTSAGFGAAKVPASLDFAASTKLNEPVRQIVMLTDFQRVSFEATESSLLGTTFDRIKKSPLAPSIVLWDVGQEVKENVAIESLDFSRLMVGVGQKIQIRANLRNFGDASHPDLRVTLKVDGKDKASSQVNLGPQSKAQVLFTQAFDAPGSHVVEIATEPDALAADNTMLASIPVRDRIPALLVDGAPGATPDDIKSETGYLQIALSPFAAGKVELSDLLAPRVTTVEGLNAKALAESQVVVLANVRRLGDDQLRALEDFVTNGGGLLVFPGDKTEAAWWNGQFAKLAPLPLGSIAGDLKEGVPGVGIVGQRFDNPALELFNDPRNGSLGEAAIKVWFKLRAPEKTGGPDDPVVLARLDSGDPFLAEKKFGEGRVIACATACDADWSNLPARPSFLPLVQRLAVYLASNVYPPRNLEIGQQLISFLPADTAGKKAQLTGPDGVTLDLPVVKKGERGVVEHGPVRVPGLYTLVPPGGQPIHYVFNADRRESDLARLSESEVNDLARAHDIPVVRSAADYKALEAKQRYGSEIWKWALLALLVLIFLELILQRIFGRQRGTVGVGSALAKDMKREMEAAR